MYSRTRYISTTATVILHGLFWAVVYLFYSYFLGYGGRDTRFISSFVWFLMPVTMCVCYFFQLYLIPQYLIRGAYWRFALYSLYTFIVSTHVIVLSIFFGLIYLMGPTPEHTAPMSRGIPFIALGVFLVVLVFVFIDLVVRYYGIHAQQEELKRKYIETQLHLKEQELKYLKMQVHPHFLFNSLNTIYGYALTKKDEAPEMIMLLSNLLDYILYQVNKPSVAIRDELDHMKDYIKLEEMRFSDTLQVTMTSEVANPNLQIAPMLLIPFVENAFKHGCITDGTYPVDIKLLANESHLTFSVTNAHNSIQTNQEGLGLSNLQKRLTLLYPDAHQLSINTTENTYSISLSLQPSALKTHNS